MWRRSSCSGSNRIRRCRRCIPSRDHSRCLPVPQGAEFPLAWSAQELVLVLAKKDLDAAFEVAHALKGMYGNISLTPIYKPLSEMTELLRSRTDTDYSALLAEAKKQKKILEELAL